MPTALAAAWLVQDRSPLGEGEGAYLGCPASGELLGVLVGLASVTFQSTVFSGNCGGIRTAKGAVGHQKGSSKRPGLFPVVDNGWHLQPGSLSLREGSISSTTSILWTLWR